MNITMNTQRKRTAAEIIGFHFGSDIHDIQDARYQPTRFSSPAVYALGENYYCAPSGNQKPPHVFGLWTVLAEHYGRTIYVASANQDEDE